MKNKCYCSPLLQALATRRRSSRLLSWMIAGILMATTPAFAGDAPQWMHSLVNAPLPAYDDKTDAVLLYSETNVTVISADKIRTQIREAYKILRPNGRQRGVLAIDFGPQKKIKSIHGWCIPAQGKDYEVKEKDAVEIAPDTQG